MPNHRTTPEAKAASWFLRQIDLRTVIGIVAGIVSLLVTGVIFWKESHEQWDKTTKVEETVQRKADIDDLKALKDQVTRQYTTAKEDKEKEMKAIEEIADWKHEQEGYWKTMKELGWPEKFINR